MNITRSQELVKYCRIYHELIFICYSYKLTSSAIVSCNREAVKKKLYFLTATARLTKVFSLHSEEQLHNPLFSFRVKVEKVKWMHSLALNSSLDFGYQNETYFFVFEIHLHCIFIAWLKSLQLRWEKYPRFVQYKWNLYYVLHDDTIIMEYCETLL